MRFSENWLRERVDIPANRDELLARLTLSGLEVESVEALGAGLDGVVVAEIVECRPHPDAERLRVCTVDAGGNVSLTIVCGAPNARAGLKAPLATVGATLPGGLTIKAAKLRGVESSGMLCSAKELHLQDDASGLLELPAATPAGTPLAAYLGLPDASIELKLTPNRADCLSIEGLAYDVAAQFGSHIRKQPAAPIQVLTGARAEVRLQAGADCPRYCGRIIRGVNAAAISPLWLTERLRRAGLRPVSALVDITNYAMLELGQPLHAFDHQTLKGAITVRRAQAGETLKLLDERVVTLDPEFLVIADERAPVALAGIMGGWDTRCTGNTRDVFLEAAHFASAAISGRARRLGMHTDASHRFERGVDPELPRRAVERATELMLTITGGQPGPVEEAVLPQYLRQPPSVILRRERLRRVLGLDLADSEVERILLALGMQVTATGNGWMVVPPSRRFDIDCEEDLIEEVIRIHGYDRVPTHAPRGELHLASIPESRVSERRLRGQMAARGFNEALNYSFTDSAILRQWDPAEEVIALANPLSAELGAMRTALLPGLVETLRRNHARQQERIRLFEIGRVFHPAAAGPRELPRIAAVASGSAYAEQWAEPSRAADFYDLKGDLESLLALSGASNEFRFESVTEITWLHPGKSARIWRGGTRLGYLGHLHPRLLKQLDLAGETVVFELDLEPLISARVPRVAEVSRFPSLRRDLAVVVPEEVPWSALESSLRKALGAELREVFVFDQYRGPGLETGFKSLAMGLIVQDVSRTLTDLDADRVLAVATKALERDCGAQRRG